MLRPYRFPYAFPDDPVRLAKEIHSLVRFSKRTTELRLLSRPTGSSRFGRLERGLSSPVALSPTGFMPYCTALLGVLFSVRSRYLFAIGLEEWRLLTTSQLLSLPVLTKMFQFRTFPIARGNCGGDSHSEILSSTLPCSSLRLIAAWHVLLRHSSRAIHQPA